MSIDGAAAVLVVGFILGWVARRLLVRKNGKGRTTIVIRRNGQDPDD